MDTYGELMVDLVDCDVEEIDYQAVWTEKALDYFISQLKYVKRHTFSSEQEMLQVVTNRMSHRNFPFTYDQIETKYNSLKKMFTDKQEKNQTIESELVSLFGVPKTTTSKRSTFEELLPSVSSRSQERSTSPKNNDKTKIIWTKKSTRIFVDLLEEYRPQLGTTIHTKKSMCMEICKRLKLLGFEYTDAQVANKWKYMLKYYRNRVETMQNGKAPKINSCTISAFPELFDVPAPSMRHIAKNYDSTISFNNDQKLPFYDDGYDDEEDNDNSLPEVNLDSSADDLNPANDPVIVKLEKNEPSSEDALNEPKSEEASKLDKIANEMENVRQDERKYQNYLLAVKKMELQAYNDRTVVLTRISEALNALTDHFKNKD